MKATGWQLALLLTAALVLRVGVAVWWQGRLAGEFAFGDSESYWSLARSIAEDEPYRYGAADSAAFRTPGYPILLAPLFWLSGGHPPVIGGRILGAVLGTLSVAGVWWLGRTLFSAAAGWVAGGIAAVYPGAIAASAMILAEAPFCPLMLGNLMLWIAAWRAGSARVAAGWGLTAGVAAGAATLVRPSWLLFLPFAAMVGVVFGPRRSRQLGLAAAMAVGLVAAMSPWWIRNEIVLGRAVLTTTEVGASLYDGLGPQADGSSHMDFVERFLEEESRRPADEEEPLKIRLRLPGVGGGVMVEADDGEPLEIRLDRRMREAAWEAAAAQPARVARLAGVKLLRMWNFWPNERSLSGWPVRVAIAVTYLPVLVLGLWGALRTIRSGWPYVLCWLPAVYFTLLHVVFVSSIRYRQPAELGLIVLAAGVVAPWVGGSLATTSRGSPRRHGGAEKGGRGSGQYSSKMKQVILGAAKNLRPFCPQRSYAALRMTSLLVLLRASVSPWSIPRRC